VVVIGLRTVPARPDGVASRLVQTGRTALAHNMTTESGFFKHQDGDKFHYFVYQAIPALLKLPIKPYKTATNSDYQEILSSTVQLDTERLRS
ncbi:MAG: hypothetical protein RLN92_01960, partial [Alloalcanivorax xenomutans]